MRGEAILNTVRQDRHFPTGWTLMRCLLLAVQADQKEAFTVSLAHSATPRADLLSTDGLVSLDCQFSQYQVSSFRKKPMCLFLSTKIKTILL